ncbi:MAG: shikimate dehydrogenase [Polyangiaceae bacterium]|nr:shikimate dehydrogenase [Polyangiaceae bacterium]
MHRAGYEAIGLPWVYVPFAMRSEKLAEALVGMRALGIRGFGVSMPFKIEILPLLDRLDPLAKSIGASNTIVNEDGVLVGHNTDAEGAARALEESVGSLSGKRCLVLGAGGAARAVVFGLVARGAGVSVANRSADKAAELASAAGAEVVNWADATSRDTAVDVLVNATSAGMDQGGGPTDAPVGDGAFRPGLVVMDIVYKPIATRLLERAKARGATTVHGGRMLLYQAARQFELYTGKAAPLEAMDRALRASIG